MARCLAFKISQRRVLRDVEVAGHERRSASQRLFEDGPCLLDAQFDGGDALAVATPRERSLASRAQIAHPVDRPKRRDQQAISIQLDQRDRVCANLPAFATPHGEQGHGSHLHAHAQQKCGHCVAYTHKCVDTICFCHVTCISFSRAWLAILCESIANYVMQKCSLPHPRSAAQSCHVHDRSDCTREPVALHSAETSSQRSL